MRHIMPLFVALALLVGAALTLAPAPLAATASAQTLATIDQATAVPSHPLLSDLRIRRALAYCTDRDAIIAAVYPELTAEQRQTLLMDTFLPKNHPVYAAPAADYQYPFNPEQGRQLLDAAGWTLPDGASVRSKNGMPLVIRFVTTNSQFRQVWSAVMIQNLADCGIRITPTYAPAYWLFGNTTGLVRREFELGAFAWVAQPSPGGLIRYGCDYIPAAENGWRGQNYMGWCNLTANAALLQIDKTLDSDDIASQYATIQEEFAKDMVSLPLFQRAEAESWSTNLTGPKIDPTEYSSWNLPEWELADGGDTIVVGMAEPDSMWATVTNAASSAYIGKPVGINRPYVQTNYDFQPFPGYQEQLSTLENGLAKNNDVDVKAGDTVYSKAGEPVTLEQDVVVFDKDGNEVTYDGASPLQMKQLVVEYKFLPVTWNDGTPVVIEDFVLGQKIDCDKASGAFSFITCESIADVKWAADGSLSYTVTYLPGVHTSTYFLAPFTPYPSHQVLADGRNLADVQAAEWQWLPEIAKKPLSWGPYAVKAWNKGQNLILEKNPHWQGEVVTPNVIFVFISDPNQAPAQLLSGDVDLLEKSTLSYGFASLLPAVEQGKLNLEIGPSPTWEHVDMNLGLNVQMVIQPLTPTGGTVATQAGISLTVPAGALSENATIIIEDTRTPTLESMVSLAPVRAFTLAALDGVGQPITQFNQPLRLVVTYTAAQLAERGADEETLNLFYWDGDSWEGVLPCTDCTLDKVNNRVIANLDHLAEFALASQNRFFLPTVRR